MKYRLFKITLIKFIIPFLSFSTVVHAASFDCQKAKSINEHLICEDVELSQLDDELAQVYKDSLRKSSIPKDLISNQRDAWRRREKECSSKACLVDWFAQRKAFFNVSPSNIAQVGNPKQSENLSVRQNSKPTETFPSNANKTWSYKPFAILSSKQNKQMSDAYIANKFLCKNPAETLQDSMDLMQNYDIVSTSKTDGTLTVTTFKGIQQGKNVTVSLAVDEQSKPRLVRYILVDGVPALNCQ